MSVRIVIDGLICWFVAALMLGVTIGKAFKRRAATWDRDMADIDRAGRP